MELRLERFAFLPAATLGRLTYDAELWPTLELPWRGNEHEKSCIPDGDYTLARWQSPSKGPVLLLSGVPNRDFILIHVGNYPHDSKGCILIGHEFFGTLDAPAVVRSGMAMLELLNHCGDSGPHRLRVCTYPGAILTTTKGTT